MFWHAAKFVKFQIRTNQSRREFVLWHQLASVLYLPSVIEREDLIGSVVAGTLFDLPAGNPGADAAGLKSAAAPRLNAGRA